MTEEQLKQRLDEVTDLLEDIKEYLAGHEDVDDGDYGIPQANRAMRLNMRIKEFLGEDIR